MARQRSDILVVDDDRAIRTLLTDLLTTNPARHVYTAADGTAALTFLTLVRPDLIVLDIRLPGLDGIALYRLIRQRAVLDDVPVLFLSALDRALTATLDGHFAWLSKPFEPDDLEALVADLLGEIAT